MIANSVSDLVVLPHRAGVVTAHHTLLARELDNSVGHQVGLAQVSGAAGIGGQVGTR